MKLLKLFTNRPTPTPEEWALEHADKCSPDQLIAAAIMESMAKNFTAWRCETDRETSNYGYYDQLIPEVDPRGFHPRVRGDRRDGTTRYAIVLTTNKPKKLVVKLSWDALKAERWQATKYMSWIYAVEFQPGKVNDLEIDAACAEEIARSYYRLKALDQATKKAALEAQQAMQLNEKKWDFACDLLGMERNEQGALVPKMQGHGAGFKMPRIMVKDEPAIDGNLKPL